MQRHAGGDPRLPGTEGTQERDVFDRFKADEQNPESNHRPCYQQNQGNQKMIQDSRKPVYTIKQQHVASPSSSSTCDVCALKQIEGNYSHYNTQVSFCAQTATGDNKFNMSRMFFSFKSDGCLIKCPQTES